MVIPRLLMASALTVNRAALSYSPKTSSHTHTLFLPQGHFSMRTEVMKAYIADDGCVHIVANRAHMAEQLTGLDLDRARTLTNVTHHWARRMREVTPPVTELLRVRSVWCDAKVGGGCAACGAMQRWGACGVMQGWHVVWCNAMQRWVACGVMQGWVARRFLWNGR